MRIGNIPILPPVIQQSSSSLFKMILSRYKNRKPLCNLSALTENDGLQLQIYNFFLNCMKNLQFIAVRMLFSPIMYSCLLPYKERTYASEKQTNEVNRSKISTGPAYITVTRNQIHHSSLQCLENATSLSLSRYSCKNLNGKGYVISSSH